MSDEEKKTRSTTGVKFSQFTKVDDGEGVQLVGLKGNSNVRVDVSDLTVEIPEVTTSTVLLENDDALRNSRGQFMSTEGMASLNTQKDANRFLNEKITEAQGSIAEVQGTLDGINTQVADGLEGQRMLQDKINALEGAVGEHSFVFEGTSQSPRDGQFILKDEGGMNTNTLSSGKVISFSEQDRDGVTVSWGRVAEGDVLRFSDIAMQTDEIRITGQVGPSAFTYEMMGGTQDRLSEAPYDFILLSSFDPAGLATTEYVDARTNSKIGRNAIWTLGADQPWELRQNNTEGTEQKFIKIHDGWMNLTNVATPSSSREAANKSYVDQAIAAAVANILNQQSAPKPAQLSWKWGGESTNAPGTGSFCKNGNRWKFNKKTFNGVEITLEDTKSWGAAGDAAIELSIWRTDGAANKWKMIKHLEIDHVDWAKEYGGNFWIEFHQMWESNKLTLVSGAEYYVCVGGFF